MITDQFSIPGVQQFNCHGDPSTVSQRWEKWKKSFSYFIAASGINADPRKKALLLHLAGPATQDIYETLTVAADCTIADALTALDAYFIPRKNVPFERSVFHSARQDHGESIEQFTTRLRTLAATCEYGAEKDNQIRDQLISACSSNRFRKRLLEKDNLTLTVALQLGQLLENVDHQNTEMVRSAGKGKIPDTSCIKSDDEYLNFLAWKKSRPHGKTVSPNFSSSSGQSCSRCGAKGHQGKDCKRTKDATCHKCGKKGHWKTVCFSQNKQVGGSPSKSSRNKSKFKGGKSTPVYNMRDGPSSSDDDDIYVFHLGDPKVPHELFPVRCGNNHIDLLIDSGSKLNILDENDFNKLHPKPPLLNSETRIYAYDSRKPLEVMGTFKTVIGALDNNASAKFYVVKGNGGSLLGKPSAIEINLLRVGPPVHNEHVSPIAFQSTKIQNILDKHQDIFSGVGKLKDFQLKLHIDEKVTPVQQLFRRIPFHTREKLSKELERLKKLDIIEPVDGPTSWVNPVVVVSRANGKVRLCLDMRKANNAIIRERHVIPRINDVLAELNKPIMFSKIDLRDGYHQLELHPHSREITTFMTHEGLFRYKRLIYGVNSAFECFQKQIELVIAGIDGCKNISDDILIWGSTETEHNERLSKVLDRLAESGLKINLSKCIFGTNEISFAGHHLSQKGISPVKSRIDSINLMRRPTNVTEVRSFLGMVNFCNKFILNYSVITAPLRLLTKKGQQFIWGDEQQTAFDKLKECLTSADVMAFHNPGAKTKLIVDGSPIGAGAILSQEQADGSYRPIAYGSVALTGVQQRYSQTEREALAVLWACEHFHHYLYDRVFTIITDPFFHGVLYVPFLFF